uniref:Putative secreted peptide n=1 Tax=Anopheles braziliensis TaxID=58242 RepID=A0A2M3ZVJ1_9DIPT
MLLLLLLLLLTRLLRHTEWCVGIVRYDDDTGGGTRARIRLLLATTIPPSSAVMVMVAMVLRLRVLHDDLLLLVPLLHTDRWDVLHIPDLLQEAGQLAVL